MSRMKQDIEARLDVDAQGQIVTTRGQSRILATRLRYERLLDDLELKARAATPGPWRFGDWKAVFGTREDPKRMTVLERNLSHAGAEPYACGREDDRYEVMRLEEPTAEFPADASHVAANDPSTTLALIARLRELEAVAAVAYDITHEEGALELQVGDVVDFEDVDKIERMARALLDIGMLYKKGAVLP